MDPKVVDEIILKIKERHGKMMVIEDKSTPLLAWTLSPQRTTKLKF